MRVPFVIYTVPWRRSATEEIVANDRYGTHGGCHLCRPISPTTRPELKVRIARCLISLVTIVHSDSGGFSVLIIFNATFDRMP